jgi:hypothetical protein
MYYRRGQRFSCQYNLFIICFQNKIFQSIDEHAYEKERETHMIGFHLNVQFEFRVSTRAYGKPYKDDKNSLFRFV